MASKRRSAATTTEANQAAGPTPAKRSRGKAPAKPKRPAQPSTRGRRRKHLERAIQPAKQRDANEPMDAESLSANDVIVSDKFISPRAPRKSVVVDTVASFNNALHETLKLVREAVSEGGSRAGDTPSTQNLPEFTGDSLEWIHFKEFYRETSKGRSDRENIARLFKALQGEVRESVRTLLATTNDPEAIIDTLERFYGNKTTVANRILNEIRTLPNLDVQNVNIAHFAAKLNNAVEALKSLRLTGQLSSTDLLRGVVEKLPTTLKYGYSRYVRGVAENKTDLEKITDFINQEADFAVSSGIFDIEPIPSVTPRYFETPTRAQRNVRTAAVHTVVKEYNDRATYAGPKGDRECAFCKQKGHGLINCENFARETVARRWSITQKARACFRCLKFGHTRYNCRSNEQCRVCRKRHHVLLHDQKRDSGRTTEMVQVNFATEDEKQRDTGSK